jgi:hypothetical protein
VGAKYIGKIAYGDPRSEDESDRDPGKDLYRTMRLDNIDIIQHGANRDGERDAEEFHKGGPALLENMVEARSHKVYRNDKPKVLQTSRHKGSSKGLSPLTLYNTMQTKMLSGMRRTFMMADRLSSRI